MISHILKNLIEQAKVDEEQAFVQALEALEPHLQKPRPKWVTFYQNWGKNSNILDSEILPITMGQVREIS